VNADAASNVSTDTTETLNGEYPFLPANHSTTHFTDGWLDFYRPDTTEFEWVGVGFIRANSGVPASGGRIVLAGEIDRFKIRGSVDGEVMASDAALSLFWR
jgi:hypothetical protein